MHVRQHIYTHIYVHMNTHMYAYHEQSPQHEKREAYAALHANLAKLQAATGDFSQHFIKVVGVADSAQQMATHFRESMSPLSADAR